MTATHPYAALPESAFWRPAVAAKLPLDITGLWRPRFPLGADDSFATYGSCFAQEFSRALSARHFRWVCLERGPDECGPELARRYGYGVFSARTGNIYTPSLLNQWAGWASGEAAVPGETWPQAERFIDPVRPRVEPAGFGTAAELAASRRQTVEAFAASIRNATCLVFTLGLTEHWVNARTGLEYPMCPGTVAGRFDPAQHRFQNLCFDEARGHLLQALERLRRINPALKLLLTVSPVPLTATASGQHVLVASTQAKSTLRAVAADLAATQPLVDYFPSYEMIASPPFGADFFEANKREVSERGVAFVMNSFFQAVGDERVAQPPQAAARDPGRSSAGKAAQRRLARTDGRRKGRQAAVCEESLLQAFEP